MTKRGEDLNFDFSGSSPQMNDTTNSTWAGTMAQLAVVLTDFLFWDVPWSDGKFVPVTASAPEGSILNCAFPAACGGAPGVGVTAKMAASECIAKMLYAGGRRRTSMRPGKASGTAGGPCPSTAATTGPAWSRPGPLRRPRFRPWRHARAGRRALRWEHEHPLRRHQRHRTHRDAIPLCLLHQEFPSGRRRARQVPRWRGQLPAVHDLRFPGHHGELHALRRHPRGRGPLRRLSPPASAAPGRCSIPKARQFSTACERATPQALASWSRKAGAESLIRHR